MVRLCIVTSIFLAFGPVTKTILQKGDIMLFVFSDLKSWEHVSDSPFDWLADFTILLLRSSFNVSIG